MAKTCTFIKNILQRRCFPANIAEFLGRPILKNICERLLLASAVNVTTSINDTVNSKFNQLSNRLNEIGTRISETKTLAENNTSRLEQLEDESKITNSRLEEYSRKIEQ